MILQRPLLFFDIESTGTDPAKDRIATLSARKLLPSTLGLSQHGLDCKFNPGATMSDEVIAIHGITNEEVQKYPSFRTAATAIFDYFQDCDLAGFNLSNFDIPILWEEFHRCGIIWNLDGVQVVDVGSIFKKKEARTLSAAVKFYLNREHDGAHTAAADVEATVDVLFGQLDRYQDLAAMTLAQLDEFGQFEKRVDLAGKIVLLEDGSPAYNIGKAKGVRVKDDPGFGNWMLKNDFSENTKMHLRKILGL